MSIEALGGIVDLQGNYTRFYGEKDKIKYDETLSFLLKEDLLNQMETDKVYEHLGTGKMFVMRGKVCPTL